MATYTWLFTPGLFTPGLSFLESNSNVNCASDPAATSDTNATALTKTQCTGQAPLALHMDSLLAPPTESVPLEASCTTADGHWVRPQSTEAGQRLDRTHQALLSTAHLYFSSGSETPAGVSPQEGSSHLATCHSTSVTKAHVEEDPYAPKSKEGEGIGQFSSSL